MMFDELTGSSPGGLREVHLPGRAGAAGSAAGAGGDRVQRMQENRDEVASGAGGAGEAPGRVGQAGNPQQAFSDKVPRNAPCPCGSGKKYKKCHGAAAQPSSQRAAQQDGGVVSSQMSSSATQLEPVGQIEASRLRRRAAYGGAFESVFTSNRWTCSCCRRSMSAPEERAADAPATEISHGPPST